MPLNVLKYHLENCPESHRVDGITHWPVPDPEAGGRPAAGALLGRTPRAGRTLRLSCGSSSCPRESPSGDGRANTRSLPWTSSDSGSRHSKKPLPPGQIKGHYAETGGKGSLHVHNVCSFVLWRWPGSHHAAIPPHLACGSRGSLTSQEPEHPAPSTCDHVVPTVRLEPRTGP